MTLERINGTKGYEPGNVKWATRKEQTRNRPTYNKLTLTDAEAIRKLQYKHTPGTMAEMYGVSTSTVYDILGKRKWA
jgi:hypothetical protein